MNPDEGDVAEKGNEKGKPNGKTAQNRWGCALEQDKKMGDSQIASKPDTQNTHKKKKERKNKKGTEEETWEVNI